MKTLALMIVMAALSACGRSARPPDETTETWTSGDDEALGIVAEEGEAESSREGETESSREGETESSREGETESSSA